MSSGFGIRVSDFSRISTFGIRIFCRIGKFHHIVEAIVGASHVEDGDQIRMRPRDRFVFLDTLELTCERPDIAELIAANDLHGS